MKTNKCIKLVAAALPLMLLCLLFTTAPAHAVGTLAGTTISNTASMTYSDASANSFSTVSNTVDVTVTSVFAVSVTCDNATGQNANSNTTANYACTLTNTSNDSNTFALSAASVPGWSTAIIFDTNGDGIRDVGEVAATATTGALVADATYRFFMAVTVPANTAHNTTSIATLTVVGSGDATAVDDTTVARTTTAQAPALTVAKTVRNVTTAGGFLASGVTAKPLEILEYQLLVTNGGTVQATNNVLSDVLDPNVTYLPSSLWVGPDGSGSVAPNVNKSDAPAGDAACGIDACGAANFNALVGPPSGTVTFNLGNGATELAGGSLAPASTVYVYYRVTVK